MCQLLVENVKEADFHHQKWHCGNKGAMVQKRSKRIFGPLRTRDLKEAWFYLWLVFFSSIFGLKFFFEFNSGIVT